MNSTDEQVRRVAAIVLAQDDEEAKARLLIFSRARYNRGEEDDMGGGRMGIAQAILEASGLIEEFEEERQKGIQQGQVIGGRKMLRAALHARFPGLETLVEIDRITSLDDLELLIKKVYSSSHPEEVHAAILSACSKPI